MSYSAGVHTDLTGDVTNLSSRTFHDRVAVAAGLTAIGIVPLAFLPESGYHFANLPKLVILLTSAAVVAISLFVRALTAPEGINPIPLPLLMLVFLSVLQWSRALSPLEASILLFCMVGSVTISFGLTTAGQDRDQVVRVVVVVAGVVSLIGVLETLGVSAAQLRSAGRPSATIGFRNTAAAYAAGCLPFAVYLATRRSALDRLSGAISAPIIILFILYTRSRGAWVGISLAAIVAAGWWLFVGGRGRKALPGRSVAITAAVLGAVTLLATMQPSFEDTTVSRLDEKKQSIEATVSSFTTLGGDRDRLAIWKHTVEMISAYPIGVGLGNWSAFYPAYDRGGVLHLNSSPRRPHNDFLWIAAELGIAGLGLFLVILFGPVYRAVRTTEALPVAAGCAVVAVAAHAFFSFPREQSAPSLVLWLSVAICCAGTSERRRIHPTVVWGGLLILCLLGSVYAWRAQISDLHFAKGLIAQERKTLVKQEAEAQSSLDYGPADHRAFLLMGDALKERGAFREAVDLYDRYLSVQPHLGAVKNNLGQALNAIGDHSRAESILLAGREVLPDDRSLIHNLVEAYRQQGKFVEALALYDGGVRFTDEHVNLGFLYAEIDSLDKAVAHYQQALELEPERTRVIYSLAGIFMLQGQYGEAIANYTRYIESHSPNSTLVRRSVARLRQCYTSWAIQMLEVGNPDRAIELLLKRETLGEMSATDVHTLAVAYGRIGAYEKAESAARKALKLDGSMTIASLTLGNALFEQDDREAFEHYRKFRDDWKGDPILTLLAESRMRSSSR